MNTQSEFYKQKHENELMILEEELKIKHELKSVVKSKDIVMNLLSMPFQSNTEKEEQPIISDRTPKNESNNLFQNGIQLVRAIKDLTLLSKKIIRQIKS